jgi:hypothetical protein
MELGKIKEWLEAIGLLAGVISLVFVGFEIQQSREIAIAGQYQARTELLMSMTMTRLETPEIRQVAGESLREGYLDVAKSSPESVELTRQISEMSNERLALEYFNMFMVLRFIDNNHYQYQHGYYEEEAWQTAVRVVDEIVASDFDMLSWRLMRYEFRTSFQDFIDNRENAHRDVGAT